MYKLHYYIKKIHVLLCLCLTVFFVSEGFSEEKVISLGGKNGWPKFSVNDDVTFGKGRFGYTCVELAKNARKSTENTDLLLNFEKSVSDAASNYTVVKNNLVQTGSAVMGKYCALSRGRDSGLELKGKPGTVFGTEGNAGSFAIEFWIKPSVAENGEVVFSWTSSRTVHDYVVYQMIMATFSGGHIEWCFKNVFDGYSKNNGEIILTSYSMIIPDKWAHHVLVFNEENGLLEYKIDGRTESLVHLTSTGHEYGSIYHPVLGLPNSIFLCEKFTGFIDDFRILHSLPAENGVAERASSETIESLTGRKYDSFKVSGGRFETEPIMTVPGAVFQKIEVEQFVPAQTEIRYYVRSGDNFFGWTDSEPAWTELIPGKTEENVTGRYIQLAADLFPDGEGSKSPSVTEIKLFYYEPPLPLAPSKVKAAAGDGYVDLNWNFSLDNSTQGYYVYYGTRPGEYLGTDSDAGSSPVKVGNVNSFRVTGLKNGVIYYFSVASYSKYDEKIIGNFSHEVYARPKKRK